MTRRYLPLHFKCFFLSLFVFLAFDSKAVVYTVDRGGGAIGNGAGNVGSLAYVLDRMRGTVGPHTVNFTFTGVINHTGGPAATDGDFWKAPWTVSVNNNGGVQTAANTVTFNGNGVTLDWSEYPNTNGVNYGTSALTIFGSYVTLNDMTFINGSPGGITSADGTQNYNAGAGVVIADASGIPLANPLTDVIFNNCTFRDNGSVGVFNSTFAAAPRSAVGLERVFLNDCSSTNNGLSGVQFSHTDVVEIRGGNYSDNGNHGIFFTGETYINGVIIPATDLAQAIGVTNGVVTDGVTPILTQRNGNGGVTIAGNSTNNLIDDVESSDNQEHGLWLRLASSDNTIQNCTSYDNGGGALSCGVNVSLGGNSNNNILNNTCYNNQDFGIYLYDNYGLPNNNNIISGNEVYDNGIHGIYILNSTLSFVRNNTVYGNGTSGVGDGIQFGNSSSNGEISGNEVYDNNNNGINVTEGVLIPLDPFDANTVNIPAAGSNNNDVFDNYVGILRNGTVQGNQDNGILIQVSTDNQVGVGGRNFVSGNGGHGISLDRIPNGATSIIRDNYVGTNLAGTADEGNTLNGIFLTECQNVFVEDNLVSGNDLDGIQLGNAAANVAADVVTFTNNIIGLDVNGTAAIPNTRHGINVDNAAFVNIGDGSAAGRNIVSANGEDGIQISNNANNVTVDDNYVGLDINGTETNNLGNTQDGIDMTGANNNILNGNLISDNGANGIIVQQASGANNPNTITGNTIGLDATGTNAGNTLNGIALTDNSTNNVIGGTQATGNIIGFNGGDGISITDNSDGNQISGNYIGITAVDANIANVGNGVSVDGNSVNNIIGLANALAANESNAISNNGANGILITTNANAGNENLIRGNIIGMDATTNNDRPNGESGVLIDGGDFNIVGGDRTQGFGNIIAGAHDFQIEIINAADNNSVYGNYIGCNFFNTMFSSTSHAINVDASSNSNIGGAGNLGNVIAYDGGAIGAASVVIQNASNSNNVSNNYFALAFNGDTEIGVIPTAVWIRDNSDNNNVGLNGPNVIPSTTDHAIRVEGPNSADNTVEGNLIGIEPVGNNNTGIDGHGVSVFQATGTTVQNNQISRILNNNNGVHVENVNGGNPTLVITNLIQPDNGVVNSGHGIRALDVNATITIDSNTVLSSDSAGIQVHTGATVQIANNILGGNGLNGVEISNITDATINSNFIGTDDTDANNGNTLNGIWVHDNIGQSTFLIAGNTINNNGQNGIHIDGEIGANSSIRDNNIGVQSDEVTASGNTLNGILVNDVNNQLSINTGNIIAASGEHGISFVNASNASIQGNFIGTSFTNTGADTNDLGNTLNGINFFNGSSSNTVDGTNFIAYNQIAVNVDGATTIENTIVENSIFCNTQGDLGGIIHANGGNINFPSVPTNRFDTISAFIFNNTGTAQIQLPADGITWTDGVRVDVYQKDAACENCRQGMVHVTTETIAGGNFTYDLGWAFDISSDQCDDYTITLTDADGNTSEFSTCSQCVQSCIPLNAYYVDPSPFTDTLEFCIGAGNTTLTANDSSITTDQIQWFQVQAGGDIPSGNTFNLVHTEPAQGDTASYYFAYFEDVNCAALSDTVTIIYIDNATIDLPQAAETICEGSTFDITGAVAEFVDSTTISWSTSSGRGTFTPANSFATTFTPDPLDVGSTITITVTVDGLDADGTNCGPATDNFDLTINEQPTVDAGQGTTICAGESVDLSTVGAVFTPAGSTITWSVSPDGNVGTITNPNSANATYSPGADGVDTLRLTVTAPAACLDISDSIIIRALPSPSATIPVDTATCQDSPVVLDVTNLQNAVDAEWSILSGNGTLADDGVTPSIQATYTPNAADYGTTVQLQYRMIGAVPGSCQIVDNTIEIRVDDLPDVVLPANDDVCVGDVTPNYTATGNLVNNLVWTTGPVGVAINQISNTTFNYTGEAGRGSFDVIATTQTNGRCPADDDTITITVNELPNPAISGNTPVCGLSVDTYTVSPFDANSTYNWSVSAGSVVGAGQTADVTFPVAGTVTITVEETNSNGCENTGTFDVTVTPVLDVTVDVSASVTCEGEDIAVAADPGTTPGNLTYQWFVVDQNTAVATPVAGTGATNTILGASINSGDDIRVIVTSDYACPTGGVATATDDVTPVINPFPDASALGETVCEGDAASLLATDANGLPGVTYQWFLNGSPIAGATSNPYTLSSSSLNDAGAYTVEIANGSCTDLSDPVQLSVLDLEVFISSAVADGGFINAGESVTLTTNLPDDGTYEFVWTPSGEVDTNTITYRSDLDSPLQIVFGVQASLQGGGCPDIDSYVINIIKPINPPNVITPPDGETGDNVNDSWILDGIESYPEVDIKVFNRWGNVVWKFDGPGTEYASNPWSGTNQNGELLPLATYYYVIDLLIDNQVFTGYVSVIR